MTKMTTAMIRSLKSDWFLYLLFLAVLVALWASLLKHEHNDFPSISMSEHSDSTWMAPSLYVDNEVTGENRELVIYGEELIAHTARYLGPNGSIARLTNGMNCWEVKGAYKWNWPSAAS